MAVIHRDHLSFESGHNSGIPRAVLVVGLTLVVGGVLAFAAAVVIGILAASDGSSSTSDSAGLLPIGGLSVVIGLLLASAGMAMARRAAGE